MMRYYLVPVVGDGVTATRRPAYISDLAQITWGAMDYGHEPWMLAHADLSDFDHAIIAAKPDVVVFPALDSVLPDDWRVVHLPRLEERKFPAHWVGNSVTTRELLKRLGHFCCFAQRYSALADEPVEAEHEATLRDGLTADGVAHDWIPVESWQNLHRTQNILGKLRDKLDEDGHPDNARVTAGQVGLLARYLKSANKERNFMAGAKGKEIRAAHGRLKAIHDTQANFVQRFRPFRDGAGLEHAPVDLPSTQRDNWLRAAQSFGTSIFATQPARRNLLAFSQEELFPVHLGEML